jgi:hypothetical protein
MRKRYDGSFKARVALEAIKGGPDSVRDSGCVRRPSEPDYPEVLFLNPRKRCINGVIREGAVLVLATSSGVLPEVPALFSVRGWELDTGERYGGCVSLTLACTRTGKFTLLVSL